MIKRGRRIKDYFHNNMFTAVMLSIIILLSLTNTALLYKIILSLGV